MYELSLALSLCVCTYMCMYLYLHYPKQLLAMDALMETAL